ncbi:MAG: CubicO group peptidase (beta-lactamase class C family) [Candidatus Aldehydirespiratoraceae bacterium]|jgi:CubicO group peptidase (beta-lactamase class C family)
MDGTHHPDFSDVAATFAQQVKRTDGGAALAIRHRGEVVVDLWGGERNDDGDPWESDTLAMCFSTTKGIASLALHLQVEAGLLNYDDKVAKHWPEFAQNGKGNVTVRHVLSHSSGLHRLRTVIDDATEMLDWDHMVDALARQPPAYKPGTKTGYHALTYGWLAGELVRRATGRELADIVENDIAVPLGLNGLYLGCPPDQRHRVAPLKHLGSVLSRGPAPVRQLRRLVVGGVNAALSLTRSPLNTRRMINALLPRGMEDVLVSPAIMDASIPAVNGFLSARSLATMYAVLAGGGEVNGVRLLSPEIIGEIGEQQNNRRDLVLVVPMRWRLGYHRVLGTGRTGGEAFGHYGFGGSGAWADPSRNLSMAMTCNRGGGTPVGDARIIALSRGAMEAADNR